MRGNAVEPRLERSSPVVVDRRSRMVGGAAAQEPRIGAFVASSHSVALSGLRGFSVLVGSRILLRVRRHIFVIAIKNIFLLAIGFEDTK